MAEQHTLPDIRGGDEAHRILNEVHPPSEILVASDFHLGRGRQPDTRRFVRTENFISDQAFGRWLRAMRPEENKLLILNGDTFDFIRIGDYPGSTEESTEEFDKWRSLLARLGVDKSVEQLRAAISKSEQRFGLQTEDYKCVWKLLQIAEGHEEFFHALAQWVKDGGSLLMVKGNHDLELYWPLVRRALCAFLEDHGASKEAISQRVFYCDSSICIGNVYIEHGHQYDSQQRIKDGPTLPHRPSELNLPLSTFVARYLVNPLEKLEPFLGSIRPTERILWIILRRHPIAGITVLSRSLRFIRRAAEVSRIRDSFWFTIYFATVALPLVTFALFAFILIYYRTRGWLASGSHKWILLFGVVGILAPYIAAALREFFFWLANRHRPAIGEDEFAQGVYKKIEATFSPDKEIYAVMGHTHDQDVQYLHVPKGPKVLYLNTGAWIPVWPEDRPDLAGQVLFPFVHFQLRSKSEYRHCYYEWRDDRGQPAEAYILAPAGK